MSYWGLHNIISSKALVVMSWEGRLQFMFKFDDQNLVRALLKVTFAFYFASYFKIDT